MFRGVAITCLGFLAVLFLAAWTHGNSSSGNFLTDGGANILTGSSGADLLLAQ